MSESLLLVNPRRRKKRKGRMPAGLRRYWAARRGSGRKRRRKARSVMTNPRRRRRYTRHVRRARRRRNPIVRAYRRRRARRSNPRRFRRARHRNPFSMGGLKSVLMPAAIGAGGAIALSIAYGYAAPKLPATFTTGYFPALVKIAGAIGIGMLAGKMLGREKGRYVTLGGLTVVLVGVISPLVAQAVPTLGLHGLAGDYVPFRPGVGAYMRNPQLGFYSPAAVIGGSGTPALGRFGAYMRNTPGSPMADLTGSNYQWNQDGM